ncbi:MAG: hypothetical protein WC969_03325 [Elusimicrobiota bacterium]|jgi:hypothetical protein
MRKVLTLGSTVLALAGLLWILSFFSWDIRTAIDRRLYPAPPAAPSPLSSAVEADMLRVRRAEFESVFRRVTGLLEAAEGQGLSVSVLRGKLDRARSLAEAGRFRDANMLLNLIEVRIPRKRERLVPAAEDEPDYAEQSSLRAKPARASRRKGKAPR